MRIFVWLVLLCMTISFAQEKDQIKIIWQLLEPEYQDSRRMSKITFEEFLAIVEEAKSYHNLQELQKKLESSPSFLKEFRTALKKSTNRVSIKVWLETEEKDTREKEAKILAEIGTWKDLLDDVYQRESLDSPNQVTEDFKFSEEARLRILLTLLRVKKYQHSAFWQLQNSKPIEQISESTWSVIQENLSMDNFFVRLYTLQSLDVSILKENESLPLGESFWNNSFTIPENIALAKSLGNEIQLAKIAHQANTYQHQQRLLIWESLLEAGMALPVWSNTTRHPETSYLVANLMEHFFSSDIAFWKSNWEIIKGFRLSEVRENIKIWQKLHKAQTVFSYDGYWLEIEQAVENNSGTEIVLLNSPHQKIRWEKTQSVYKNLTQLGNIFIRSGIVFVTDQEITTFPSYTFLLSSKKQQDSWKSMKRKVSLKFQGTLQELFLLISKRTALQISLDKHYSHLPLDITLHNASWEQILTIACYKKNPRFTIQVSDKTAIKVSK